jgi:hypothetical protein
MMGNTVSTGQMAGSLPAGVPPRELPKDKFVPRHPPQAQQPRGYVFPNHRTQQQQQQ